MKKNDLTRKLNEAGFEITRQGSNHEIWSNGEISIPVPRHGEINEFTAKGILKDAGILKN